MKMEKVRRYIDAIELAIKTLMTDENIDMVMPVDGKNIASYDINIRKIIPKVAAIMRGRNFCVMTTTTLYNIEYAGKLFTKEV